MICTINSPGLFGVRNCQYKSVLSQRVWEQVFQGKDEHGSCGGFCDQALIARKSPDVNVDRAQGPLPFVKLAFQNPALPQCVNSFRSWIVSSILQQFFQSTQTLVVELVWGQESLTDQECRKARG